MRYALFYTKEEADLFIPIVQYACDVVHIPEEPINIILAFEHDNKWVVSMPHEPDVLQGEIVDSIEQSVTEDVLEDS